MRNGSIFDSAESSSRVFDGILISYKSPVGLCTIKQNLGIRLGKSCVMQLISMISESKTRNFVNMIVILQTICFYFSRN